MGYTVIPLFLILISITAILVVVIRRFPQLSLLDVDNLPEVKQEKKKDEFLKKRIEARAMDAKHERRIKLAPAIQRLKEIQLSFRKYVGRVERIVVKEKERKRTEESPEERQVREQELRTLLNDATFASEQGEFSVAEKKYIAAIRIDTKNVEAYRGLAYVYYKQGQIEEAKETYRFLLQLNASDDEVYIRLAELSLEDGKYEEAIGYYEQAILINPYVSGRFATVAELLMKLQQYETAEEAIRQALDLEPQNPKYLDMLVEISIMVGNKSQAEKAFQDLRMVNPENQKLVTLKDKIDHME